VIALPVALLVAVALAMVFADQGPASVLRHLYLVPTLWAALARGAIGGGLVGALAGLLHAPVVLPAVERLGLTSQTLDGLLSLGLPIVAGLLVGRLVFALRKDVDDARLAAERLRGGEAAGENPWEALTLEWRAASPPPHGNFKSPPIVSSEPYDYGV